MHYFLSFLALILFTQCKSPTDPSDQKATESLVPKGHLFIIGGGKRPPELLQDLIEVSQIDRQGYAVILPMSSGEPDTAAYYARRQFLALGLPAEKFVSFFLKTDSIRPTQLDSLRHAQLIYLTGGDQRRFMELVGGSEVPATIREAYQKGATVAGTSAGAALMSQKMMTGDEFKHPKYTGEFRTIEAENIEIVEGLGLLPQAIVDQHFVYRMRMNRLITVAIEHPDQFCIGIDESTAIVVSGDSARVTGMSQVVVLRNPESSIKVKEGLLGSEGLELSVLLGGDRFAL